MRAVLAVALLAIPSAALAELKPGIMNATYAEPEAAKLAPGEKAPPPIPQTCKIAIVGIEDQRDPANYMGHFFDNHFEPPADRQAWIKSMVAGLGTRGFDVKFAETGAAPAGYLPLKLALKTAWLDYHNGGFYGTVILRLNSADVSRPFEKSYRGTFWRTLLMATVMGRSNDALNGAVALSLDRIADDAKVFCPN
jgi:hypothetical protein